mmetsp:Transcript_6071/g.14822  ORF Transcript_6071/g.14822 Transcript_6071/m.14822 type:complete len:179 (-) Transcript_6071:1514-2050(-)
MKIKRKKKEKKKGWKRGLSFFFFLPWVWGGSVRRFAFLPLSVFCFLFSFSSLFFHFERDGCVWVDPPLSPSLAMKTTTANTEGSKRDKGEKKHSHLLWFANGKGLVIKHIIRPLDRTGLSKRLSDACKVNGRFVVGVVGPGRVFSFDFNGFGKQLSLVFFMERQPLHQLFGTSNAMAR